MSELEAKIELFLNELEREGYEVGAGLKDEANFTPIYEKHAALFTPEALEEAKNLPTDRGRDTLVAFTIVNIIDNELKETTDKLLTAELEATITVGGKSHPFRQAQVLISREDDPAARADIDAARRKTQIALNPLYEELHERSASLAVGMGYADYCDFFEKLEGIELKALRAHTEKLLRETESIYLRGLERYRAELLKVDKPTQADMVYMRRAPQFDSLFPPAPMLPATWKTLAAMGIRAEGNPNIHLDIEHREKKSPRAFCSPVHVPEEVYLVIMPHGGADDYSSFLHELGHTLHFAFTTPGLPVAFRFLGDNSVTEAHAGLIERFCTNPEWLRNPLGIVDPCDYVGFMDFFELYMLRRYCAKFHYELEIHSGRPLADCAALYEEILSSATHVVYSKDDYMKDVDPHFYCVRYLRSWMLERQMRRTLEERFGPRWFETPGAGELLLSLWSKGQGENADEISSSLGYTGLDMDAIIEHFTTPGECKF